MNFGTWWNEYDDDPFEHIGRVIIGAMGQEMHVVMPRMSWAYVDWLVETEGRNMVQFFKDNDAVYNPAIDGCYNYWMEGAVRTAFLRRERRGLPRPHWLRAAHPDEYVDI